MRSFLSPGVFVLLLGAIPAPRAQAQTIAVQGTAIDVDLQGNMYVLDAEGNTLRMFDRSGRMEREAGGPGWQDGQFDHPAGVWARNGIDVFVADYGNHRIERFDRALSFISSLSTRDSDNPNERFGYPSDVALSRQGDLYICDTENSRIVKVDQTNKVERTFGDFGAGKGRLTMPRKVGLGPKDAIYVLDGARVAVFDAFGNYLRDLVPGVFNHPTGLFADNDVVAVKDSEALYFFDADGRPEGVFPLRSILPSLEEVGSFALGGGWLYLLSPAGIFTVPDPRVKRPEETH
jgi:hypothetical protein